MGFRPFPSPSQADRPRELQAPPAPVRNVAFARVLVVDDDRDTAETMACLLRLFGHDVRIALDGHQAIEAARRQRPDCILLDVGLPGLDGYEVASRLRWELAASIVLIAVTGYGQEEDRRRAFAAGFDHHFIKPLDPDALNGLLAALDVRAWSRSPVPLAGPTPAADAAPTTDPSARQRCGCQVRLDFPIRDIMIHEVIGREEGPMPPVNRQVEVTNPLGLHLRVADKIVRLANRFRAEIRVGCDGRTANARSILDLTTLAAACGSRLELEADGPEAEVAVEALVDLIGRRSDEPGR